MSFWYCRSLVDVLELFLGFWGFLEYLVPAVSHICTIHVDITGYGGWQETMCGKHCGINLSRCLAAILLHTSTWEPPWYELILN